MIKIQFLGVGSLGSSQKCASYVIDDHILFDVGFGSVTSLRNNGLDVGDIDTVIISHFHPDHIGDIIYFLVRHWEFMRKGRAKPITIIGPNGIKEVIEAYKKAILYSPNIASSVTDLIKYVEEVTKRIVILKDGKQYATETAIVEAFSVEHGSALACNGYVLNLAGFMLGFSGDTRFCENIKTQIENVDHWVIDAAHLKDKDRVMRHISLEKIAEIAKIYPAKKFYAIHRHDYVPPCDLPNNIVLPNDDDVVFLS